MNIQSVTYSKYLEISKEFLKKAL